MEQLAFFPLLPAAVRLLSSVTGLPLEVAGVVLSTVVGGLAVVAVWRLVDVLAGRHAADRAAALVSFFPGAFVFSMVYAEGFLVLGAAACLLALHRRAWVAAGAAAALAGASRPTGAVVVLACAWAAGAALARDRTDRSPLWAPALGALGPAVAAVLLWARTGWHDAWLRSEHEAWGERMDLGRAALERVRATVTDLHVSLAPRELNDLIGTLGVAFVVVTVLLLLRWRPPVPVAIVGVGTALLPLVSQQIGPRPRMLLAAFPLVVALAIPVRGRAFTALLGGSAVALTALTAVTLGSQAATP
jgi:hypothetical protein